MKFNFVLGVTPRSDSAIFRAHSNSFRSIVVSPRKYAEMPPRAYALQAAASTDAIFIDLLPRTSAHGVFIQTASATGAQVENADLMPPLKELSRFVKPQPFPLILSVFPWSTMEWFSFIYLSLFLAFSLFLLYVSVGFPLFPICFV